jgi:hypothetical protein
MQEHTDIPAPKAVLGKDRIQATVTVGGKTIDATKALAKASAKRAAGDAARDVINVSEIKQSINELLALHARAKDASACYKDAIDAVAAKAGVGKRVLRAYVKARAHDKVKEAHAGAEQLSLLFEEI